MASKDDQGAEQLTVNQFTVNQDAAGNFTGGSQLSGYLTSGFTFTIDALTHRRWTAPVDAPGVEVTTCTFDAVGNPTEPCTTAVIDVMVTWTGWGSITHVVSNVHSNSDGHSGIVHTTETNRDATATGTLGNLALGASDPSTRLSTETLVKNGH